MKKILITLLIMTLSLTTFSKWVTNEVTDAFGDKTGEKYMMCISEDKNYVMTINERNILSFGSTQADLHPKDFRFKVGSDKVEPFKGFGGWNGDRTMRYISDESSYQNEKVGSITYADFIGFMKKSNYISFTFLTYPNKEPKTVKIDCTGFTKQYNALMK